MASCRRTALYSARTRSSSAEHRRVGDGAQMGPLGLHVSPQGLHLGLVGGHARAPEVLGDGAQGHELPGGVGGHGRPVVGHRQEDGQALVVHVDGHHALGMHEAVLDEGQQALGLPAVEEDHLGLGG